MSFSFWFDRLRTCRTTSLQAPSLGAVLLEYRLADHHLHELGPVLDLGDRLRADVPAVPHDGYVVSELEDLVQPMRDVDER